MAKYEIEAILDTFNGPLGEWKLVKWKNYSDAHNLWIREILEESDDNEKEDKEDEEERKNYVDLGKTMKLIKQYATPGHPCNIKQYIGQGLEENEIGCLDIDEHLYIVTRYRDEIILADGINYCHDNKELQNWIAKAENAKKIRCIGYLFQVQDDHCASSGILIATELIRLIKLGKEIPECVEPRIGLRAKLIKALHPHPGNKDKAKDEKGQDVNLRQVQTRRCTKCNKYYVKRSTLLQHEAKCKSSQ